MFPVKITGIQVHTHSITNRTTTRQQLSASEHWNNTLPTVYTLLHKDNIQRLWIFEVLVCPLLVTERFLSQPLVCGRVFHCMSLLPPLSPSSVVVLNHISSHFLIPLSDSSLICTVPAQ